ncbi:flagellar hook-length control protein FliK [Oceanobacillus sp. CFH 90083]|uniref:flagellar hook-length control protein FliK n=1 Tax=Oceanobacillus sp. CFH 90083 TaxID=2592336 RepID=UPI00128E2A45|nr:flagellar hook-length control protein FliK [Oceanobacillus sp. CFH 90083]
MNTIMLNIADLIFPQQTDAQIKTKQGTSFGDLLLQKKNPLPELHNQTEQSRQLTDTYENLEELLPDEVLAILKDNPVLQEEMAALVMQSLSAQQKVSAGEKDEQQKVMLENLFSQRLSSLDQLELAAEMKANLQAAIDVYNQIVKLLQGIEKAADIDKTAGMLTNLLQSWNQFFEENPEMDKQEVLDDIYQQIQKTDSSMFGQAINQIAYQLLDANLLEGQTNDVTGFKALEINKVLLNLNQLMRRADSAAVEQIVNQITDLLAEGDLIDKKLLNDIRGDWSRADGQASTRLQQFIHAIQQHMQKADAAVVEQAVKQLQGLYLSTEAKLQSQQASTLDTEGLQRAEARVASWLQSIFKEVSSGVMKQNSDVNAAGQAEKNHSAKQVSEVTARIEPKLAAWLQTSFQGASPAVFKQDNLPLSRVEQFIVHMGETDASKTLSGKELIDKIETIVQNQRLQNFVRGQNPILIHLRPDNLGDMTIRFVQANGELTVQMLVSSKAVKEVLESNLHQLRNVFSPHQVTIERQDNLTVSQTDASKSSKENQNEQQQTEQQGTSADSNEQEQSAEAESFESFMEKLLSQNIEEQI